MKKNKNIENYSTEEKTKTVINDYNNIAKQYADEFYYDTSDDKYIDKFLQKLNGKRVLDVGCGLGEDCKRIEENGFDATGIDLSENMLKIEKNKYPNGKFEIMDMTNITYPENSFDEIISNCSLIHIPTELLPQTLETFKRVLKPNGKLLLILQEGRGEKMVEEPFKPGTYIYMNYFSVESITKLLREHNFKVEKIEKEETLNEFEFGNGKLIIISTNEKFI